MRLAESIYGSGKNITPDNWFTSLKLVQDLERRKVSYVGTIRKNKREVPFSFVVAKNRNKYDSIFGYTKQETLVSYVPKKGKTVVLLSSYHTSSTSISDEEHRKPEIIEFYNKTKAGVDIVDKLCGTYNTARSTRRWPMVIFYHIMNIAGINSRVIHLGNGKEYVARRNYLKKLALDLITPQLKRRALLQNLPTELQVLLAKYRVNEHVKETGPYTSPSRKRKYCGPCYQATKKKGKTQYTCRKCGIYLCLNLHTVKICQNCFENIERGTETHSE